MIKLNQLYHCILINFFRVKEDQLDLRAKKANLVFKDHLVLEVFLDLKDQRGALAIQVFPDQTANLESKDLKENRARMVWMAKQAKLVFQEKPAHPVKWDCPAHQVNRDQKGLPVFKEAPVYQVTRVTKVHRAFLVRKDHQEIKESMDLKDLQDFVAPLDLR